MTYQSDAREVMSAFQKSMAKKEKDSFLLLSQKWGVVDKEIENQINRLLKKEILSENQLYLLDDYKKLLVITQGKIAEYSKIANGVIEDNQAFFGKAGLNATQEQIRLITTNFRKLRPDIIDKFIGRSFFDGSKILDILQKSYPETAIKLTDTLLKGVSLGWNPEKTARLMIKEDLNLPLSRALRITRTESLNIMRETSIEQMQSSGVCKGFTRHEVSDCCDACAEENGKFYEFGDYPDFHVNCRGWVSPAL